MKDKVYRRALAFMCALIVVSVLYGGCRSIHSYYKMSMGDYFSYDDTGSAGNAVKAIAGSAENLIALAKRSEGGENALCISLSDNADKTLKSKTTEIQKKYLLRTLDDCVKLYNELGNRNLSETDAKYRTQIFYNIKSYYNVLCHNSYNDSAKEYNKAARQIPARLFATVTGTRSLAVYSADDVTLEG